jgi:outer membrane protein assembly factor BamB
MFRGGQDLVGKAAGSLPDSLELRWSFKTGGPVKSSAATDGERVVVGSDDKHVYCLDFHTGEKIWAFQTGDAVEGSPLILNNHVYIGSADAQLYKLDLATGALEWTYATDGKILGGANWTVQAADNTQKILVGSYDSKLHCVDAGTGKAAWTVTTDNYVNGTPAVADGKIIFGGCDGLVHVVSAGNGNELAKIEAGAYIAGSVALKEKFAYLGHYGNEVVCVDLETGTVAWQYKESGFPFFSSPAVTANSSSLEDATNLCIVSNARPAHSFGSLRRAAMSTAHLLSAATRSHLVPRMAGCMFSASRTERNYGLTRLANRSPLRLR